MSRFIRKKAIICLVLVCLLVGVVASPVSFDYDVKADSNAPNLILVDEDFEGQTVGESPSGWDVIIDNDGGSAIIEEDLDGNKTMRLEDWKGAGGSPGEVNVEKTFDAQSRTITVEFDVKVDSTEDLVRAGFLYSGGTQAVLFYFDTNGRFSYYDGNTKKQLQIYEADTWYHIKIIANPSSNLYEVYINNMDVPQASGIGFRNPVSTLDKILFGTNPAHFGKGNIDNVTVSQLDSDYVLNDEKEIVSFRLSEQTGKAYIDQDAYLINIDVKKGTDLSNLSPKITVSNWATVSPASSEAIDFSNGPVTYTVIAQDGSRQDYNVTVTESDSTKWRSELYSEDWLPIHEGGTKDSKGRFLHDFSFAGYHRGEVLIPNDPPGEVYDVTQAPYHADNSGETDTTLSIQQAIDDAGNAGGGIVYLPEGIYKVSPQGTNNYALWINQDNVVLRGSGKYDTFIFNDETNMREKAIIRVSPPHITALTDSVWHEPIDSPTMITEDLLEPTMQIPVESVAGYSVGEWIIIMADATDDFLGNIYEPWIGYGEILRGPTFYRQITAIDFAENILTIDIPTRYSLLTRDYAKVYRIAEHIEEVGLEHFSIGNRENTTPDMGEAKYLTVGTGAYEVHLSDGIFVKHTTNGWISDVQSYRPDVNSGDYHLLSDGIELFQARSMTVQNTQIQKPQYLGGGGNGYGFTIRGADNLYQNNSVAQARHNYSFKSMWTTGNVVYNTSVLEGFAVSDFHMHLSMSNLLDNVKVQDDALQAGNRLGTGVAPPWSNNN